MKQISGQVIVTGQKKPASPYVCMFEGSRQGGRFRERKLEVETKLMPITEGKISTIIRAINLLLKQSIYNI